MSEDWKTYRTRFVVRARQLTEPFTFTDINGHEHHGRPGDYVIESREGLRISRREIFEDVYVVMDSADGFPGCCLTIQSSPLTTGEQGFSRAAANEERIGALAPVQTHSEHANLHV